MEFGAVNKVEVNASEVFIANVCPNSNHFNMLIDSH